MPQVPPQKPPKPPRLPSGSADSLSLLPEASVEHILQVVLGVEGRLKTEISEQVGGLRNDVDGLDNRLLKVEVAAADTRALSAEIRTLNGHLGSLEHDVRAVLQRDAVQEGRLARLEAIASAAGTEAGAEAGKAQAKRTGKLYGAMAIALGIITTTTLDWCRTQMLSHQTSSTTQPAKP